MFDGLSAALKESGLSAALILCFLRDRGAEEAEQVLRAALPFRDRFIGVGLDSAEVGYPPSLFRRVSRWPPPKGCTGWRTPARRAARLRVGGAGHPARRAGGPRHQGDGRSAARGPAAGRADPADRVARCRTCGCARCRPCVTTSCPRCWTRAWS
ncbi:hypothetical protein [Nonomuraea rubra]|uniref:hypothetical protein n=1 Tax=Nonomuraea rubra TaxID=46180 RepID=UPI003CD0B210